MSKYEVEVYELYSTTYEVEASSFSEAIDNALDGEGSILDDSTEYIEMADRYAGPDLIDGIRSVRKAD